MNSVAAKQRARNAAMNGAKNASSVAKIEPPSSTVLMAGLAMPAVVSV